MTINNHVSELVGNTPILKLNNYMSKHQLETNIYAKLEFFNPAGSVKDRIAKAMLFKAIEDNILKSDSVIIEPTSGNTGIGLASIGASLGYQVILTMPETMSIERRNLLKAYGAKVVLTPGNLGMSGAIAKAKELAKEIPNAFIPSQFENTVNPNTHYLTTGPEIYQQLEGKIDIFVAGVGTGGTVSGVGKYLKEKNLRILLRFAYEYTEDINTDAKDKQILRHLDQIGQFINENKQLFNDVVYAVQLGLIGLWGEGHGEHFNHNKRKLANKLCEIIPE